MLFKRKGSLKKEYDQKLLSQIDYLKSKLKAEKNFRDNIFDLNEDLENKVRLAELKYFYLFKEAKTRDVKINIKS